MQSKERAGMEEEHPSASGYTEVGYRSFVAWMLPWFGCGFLRASIRRWAGVEGAGGAGEVLGRCSSRRRSGAFAFCPATHTILAFGAFDLRAVVEEALAMLSLLERQQPDLVLVDVQMPVMGDLAQRMELAAGGPAEGLTALLPQVEAEWLEIRYILDAWE